MGGTAGPLQREWTATHDGQSRVENTDPAASDSGVSELAIEETRCYGFCPTYTAIITSDGAVAYQGQGNVEYLGKWTAHVSRSAFERVARIVVDLGFFDLNAAYSHPVTDQQSVFVAASRNGPRKIVSHYAPDYSGPPRLSAIEDTLRHLVASATDWRRVKR